MLVVERKSTYLFVSVPIDVKYPIFRFLKTDKLKSDNNQKMFPILHEKNR